MTPHGGFKGNKDVTKARLHRSWSQQHSGAKHPLKQTERKHTSKVWPSSARLYRMTLLWGEAIPVPIRFSREHCGLLTRKRAELTNSGRRTLCRIARWSQRRTAEYISENRVQAESLNPVLGRAPGHTILQSADIDRIKSAGLTVLAVTRLAG